MKKITLCFMAVIAAVAMAAAPVQRGQWQAPGKASAKSEKFCKTLKKSPEDGALKVAKAPAGDGMIWDQPEGDFKYYYEWGNGFTLNDQYLQIGEVNSAGMMVWAEDNVVYIKSAISSLGNNAAWVKGTVSKDGKRIAVKYPQQVNTLESEDGEGRVTTFPLYVSVMKYNADTDTYYPVADEDNCVYYTVDKDGKIVMDGGKDFEWEYDPDTDEEYLIMPDTMLSCYYEYYEKDGSGPFPWWYGFADIAQEFTPLADDLIVNDYPMGLQFEIWALSDAMGVSQPVDVAIVGNEVFIKGIDEYTKDCVVKGSIEGNKVTFPSKQFFGVHEEYNTFMFFFGCTYGMQWYEEYQDYYEGYAYADNIVMDYDPATKTLTAPKDTGFMMTARADVMMYYSAFLEPVISAQDPESLNAAPSDPEIWDYMFNEKYQQEYFNWYLPNTNVNGAFIDTNRVYYNVFVDGERYTFSPDTYPYVLEEITDIPYNYCDDNNWDIYSEGAEHEFFIYAKGLKSFGVKLYYNAPDGKLYASNRVTYNILEDEIEVEPSGISDIDAEPIGMEFFNLQGIKVANPAPGTICIRTITFSDGTKKVAKIIAR